MKTIEKNILGIILLFVFYICFTSCNGNMEDKLEEIQKKLDVIEKKFEIEHETNNAAVSKDFHSFIKLAYLHGVINDLEFFQELDSSETLEELREDFISEVVDQNLASYDTIIIETYKIRFYNETDSNFTLAAEGYPERFNKYFLKFVLYKNTGELEWSFWTKDDPDGPNPIPDSVKEENGQLMITTDSCIFTIPQIQELKLCKSKVRSEDYEYHKLNSCTLLKFPKITVTMK
ncbi:MAG: hypothetical protein K6E76_03565 [Patescibacteria group bacterium]|nr:hypothetical protein [Patescibacteria group bacterium]